MILHFATGPPPPAGLLAHIVMGRLHRVAASFGRCRDFEGPRGMEGLHLIVRGDGHPIAGTTFCNLCIALANHGPEARRPAMNWPIGLATCADKDSDALRDLWAKNIEVCFCL